MRLLRFQRAQVHHGAAGHRRVLRAPGHDPLGPAELDRVSFAEGLRPGRCGLTLLDEAKRFEFGTRNLADQIGFGKALDFWTEIGWENVFSYIAGYTDRLKAALQEVPSLKLHTPPPYGKSSGIVTFSLGNYTSAEIQEHLKERKVLVAPLELDGSMIRVSTHVFNNEEDSERLVSGLRAMN